MTEAEQSFSGKARKRRDIIIIIIQVRYSESRSSNNDSRTARLLLLPASSRGSPKVGLLIIKVFPYLT